MTCHHVLYSFSCVPLCSNNLPLDIFGLYREVNKRGGLVVNQRYDERGRWTGGINFAGEVSAGLVA